MGPAGLRRRGVLWPPLLTSGRHHRGVRQVSGHSLESWGGQAAVAHPARDSGPTRQCALGAGLRTRAGGQETASHSGPPAPHPPRLMRPAHSASLRLNQRPLMASVVSWQSGPAQSPRSSSKGWGLPPEHSQERESSWTQAGKKLQEEPGLWTKNANGF